MIPHKYQQLKKKKIFIGIGQKWIYYEKQNCEKKISKEIYRMCNENLINEKMKCFLCNNDVIIILDEGTNDRYIILCPNCRYSLFPDIDLDLKGIISWWKNNKYENQHF
jgi:hypothetical protein